MRVGSIAVAYNEERLIGKHLKHIPQWVGTKVALVSSVPWYGEPDLPDKTDEIASKYAEVIVHNWRTEHEQRNAGLEYLHDFDWVVVLDPDEFMIKAQWDKLRNFLESAPDDAYVCQEQYVYWKDHYRAFPGEKHRQIVAVRPSVRFVDNRVVNCSFGVAPVEVHHLSWARTDKEIWNKISHYAESPKFDIKKWYEEVWLTDKRKNVHPVNPSDIASLRYAWLPEELERMDLWPN